VQVFLVRHAEAVAETVAVRDPDRNLSVVGRTQARALGERMRWHDCVPTKVWTSPLVRAVQTAEILARKIRQDEVGILEELRSEVPVPKLLAALKGRIKDGQSVALTGHDPQMTHLVSTLSRLSDDSRIQFKKGAIIRIDVDAFPPEKSKPRWYLNPDSKKPSDGLPLS